METNTARLVPTAKDTEDPSGSYFPRDKAVIFLGHWKTYHETPNFVSAQEKKKKINASDTVMLHFIILFVHCWQLPSWALG